MVLLYVLLAISCMALAAVRRPEELAGGDIVHGVIGLPGGGKTYKMTEWALRSLDAKRGRSWTGVTLWPLGVPLLGVVSYRAPRTPVRVYANFEVGRWWPAHPDAIEISRSSRRTTRIPEPCFAGKRCQRAHVPVFVPYSAIERIDDVVDLLGIRARFDPYTRRPVEEVHVYVDEVQLIAGSRKWRENSERLLAFFTQIRRRGIFMVWCSQHKDFVDVSIKRLTGSYTLCKSIVVPFFGRVFMTKRFIATLIDTPDEQHHALWHTLRIRRFRQEIADAFQSFVEVEMRPDVLVPARAPEGRAPAKRAA